MQTIRLTVSEAIVAFLEKQFVEVDGREEPFVHGVFGIFGHGNVMGLGAALSRPQVALRFYQGHNEQGMAHAAIAFAKQKNRKGIMACTTSIGPGALNMVTAAATATINRIPVLLLPGDVFACRQPDPVLQQLEVPHDYTVSVNDCFKPVSRYWDRVERPEQVMTALENAMRVLTDPVDTGAVTLSLPQDVQVERYDYPVRFFDKRIHVIDRRSPSESAIKKTAELLSKASAPLMVVGGGAHYSEAFEELAEFGSTFHIPIAETQAGKGTLVASHAMNMGTLGVLGSQAANDLAAKADCVIGIGTRWSDFTTASKTIFKNDACQIVNINVSRLDAQKLNGVEVVADAKEALRALTRELQQLQATQVGSTLNASLRWQEKNGLFINACSNARSEWLAERERAMCQKSESGSSQLQVLDELNRFVNARDIVVSASGSLPGDLVRMWQCKSPKTFHLEYGFSCMGYEVSGGLGVKLAAPDSEVYVLVGDGAFLMLHSELLTSIQEQVKINVILFNNSGFQCIRRLQTGLGEQAFGNEFRFRSQSGKLDGKAIPVDFVAIARGLGAEAFYASDADSFRSALRQAQQATRSTLIQIDVDENSMSKAYGASWRVDVALGEER